MHRPVLRLQSSHHPPPISDFPTSTRVSISLIHCGKLWVVAQLLGHLHGIEMLPGWWWCPLLLCIMCKQIPPPHLCILSNCHLPARHSLFCESFFLRLTKVIAFYWQLDSSNNILSHTTILCHQLLHLFGPDTHECSI
jgi:hypothetical protein